MLAASADGEAPMHGPKGLGGRKTAVAAAVLLVGLLGCGGAPTGQSGDLTALQKRVAAQETRIAALETRVALPQVASLATATPRPAQPTATVVPAVAGLITEGTAKGVSTAKVTIVEYLDYL
jgi:protein-disulfide isomerase